MKAALLSGDRFVGGILRNLRGELLNVKVALNKRDEGLDDIEVEKIIIREVKKRHESATLYEQNDREELAKDERKEAAILQQYLPKQLSEAEVEAIVAAKIAELSATTMQQMGQVIGAVKSEVGNTADGATISKIVKEQLQ